MRALEVFAACAAHPRRRGNRIELLFAAVHEFVHGRFCCRSALKAAANNDCLRLTRSAAGTGYDGSVEPSSTAVLFLCLEEVVPDDHQVRAIASVLDLS